MSFLPSIEGMAASNRFSQQLPKKSMYRTRHVTVEQTSEESVKRFLQSRSEGLENCHMDNKFHTMLHFTHSKNEFMKRSPDMCWQIVSDPEKFLSAQAARSPRRAPRHLPIVSPRPGRRNIARSLPTAIAGIPPLREPRSDHRVP